MKVYTKSGDQGKTSLLGGERVTKCHQKVEAYGDVDELNSFVGFLVNSMNHEFNSGNFSNLDEFISLLKKTQHILFNLGSELAASDKRSEQLKMPEIKDEDVSDLEKAMDKMDTELPKMTHFVLPGGCHSASVAHLCRTVCRRVERRIVKCYEDNFDKLPPNSLIYVNRLSDYFFVLARYLNLRKNEEEVLWIPEKS